SCFPYFHSTPHALLSFPTRRSSDLIATLSLRATEGFKKKLWIIPMTVFYAMAFFCLALTLVAGMPVAIAYGIWSAVGVALIALRSEEHTSELQSRVDLVCRLLLGKN